MSLQEGKRYACDNCRKRHQSCDRQQPECRRCRSKKLTCIYGGPPTNNSPRTTSGSQIWDPQQQWVPVPPQVAFQHEFAAERGHHATSSRRTPYALNNINASPQCSQPVSSGGHPPECLTLSDTHEPAAVHAATHERANIPQIFSTQQEISLLRHYVEHVAPFFDFFDSKAHFAFEVPRRARDDPTLANALLAVSARHANRTKPGVLIDGYLADRYHQGCLQALIPRLNGEAPAQNDNLFAMLCLLRFLEEMDVSISGMDLQGHLLGLQAVSQASRVQAKSGPKCDFWHACLWSAFRQELYMALMENRPLRCEAPVLPLNVETHDDWTWALIAVRNCGDVINQVFYQAHRVTDQMSLLRVRIADWERTRPSSFNCLSETSETQQDAHSWPQLPLLSRCHVMAEAYNVIAILLLDAHRELPRIGSQRKRVLEEIDVSVRADVRKLCGIARSNEHVPHALLVASMAITLFGERFEDPREQTRLEAIMIDTETKHGWPTLRGLRKLQEDWGVPIPAN